MIFAVSAWSRTAFGGRGAAALRAPSLSKPGPRKYAGHAIDRSVSLGVAYCRRFGEVSCSKTLNFGDFPSLSGGQIE
jgi:hypothetical protein